MQIIVKGGKTCEGDNRKLSDMDLDRLHKRRLLIEENMRDGLLSKDAMNQRDCKTEHEEDKRVQEYIKWKESKTKTGKTNEENMEELHEINREFKRRGKEGKMFDMDIMRKTEKVKYE